MTTLIAALDDSAAAEPTLETALRFAATFDATVEALQVLEDRPLQPPTDVGPRTDLSAAAVAAAHDVPLHTLRGVVEDEIVAAVESPEVIAGVVGARDSVEGRRPVGHVALRVLERSTKPIVVVPPDCRPPGPPPGRLLIALDGTEASARAIESTTDVLAAVGTDVLALHVFDAATVPRFWDQPQYEAQEWGTEFLRRFCHSRGAHLQIGSGDPGRSVLAVAAQRHADLIALAWAQDLSPGHAETVRRVLAESCVPVVLVPVDRPGPPAVAEG